MWYVGLDNNNLLYTYISAASCAWVEPGQNAGVTTTIVTVTVVAN